MIARVMEEGDRVVVLAQRGGRLRPLLDYPATPDGKRLAHELVAKIEQGLVKTGSELGAAVSGAPELAGRFRDPALEALAVAEAERVAHLHPNVLDLEHFACELAKQNELAAFVWPLPDASTSFVGAGELKPGMRVVQRGSVPGKRAATDAYGLQIKRAWEVRAIGVESCQCGGGHVFVALRLRHPIVFGMETRLLLCGEDQVEVLA